MLHCLQFPRLFLACLATVSLLAWSGCQKNTGVGKTDDSNAQPTSASEKQAAAKQKEAPKKPTTAQGVLERMAAAYKNASSYSDLGTVRLMIEMKEGEPVDVTADFSVKLVRPNKLQAKVNQGIVACDGQKWMARIGNFKEQVVMRDAPTKLSMDAIFVDNVLNQAITRGFPTKVPGLQLPPPQFALLLLEESLPVLLTDAQTELLPEPGKIDEHSCYRVQAKWPRGTATFWIDEETYVLRRMVFPGDSLFDFLGGEKRVRSVSLTADFTGAQLGGTVDPGAFRVEAPKEVELVKFFTPPQMGQLLGKKCPEFKFSDLQGKVVTPASLAGKTAVLEFWSFTRFEPCRSNLTNLQKVYEKYSSNDKVAFYSVNIDPGKIEDKVLRETVEELKLTLPVLRDPEQTSDALRIPLAPTIILLGSDGTVQDCEMDDDPDLAVMLPTKLQKLLAGENLSKAAIAQYEEQLKLQERLVDDVFQGKVSEKPGSGDDAQPAPPKVAAASQPKTLKLTSLWKCAELKAPGNILVLPKADGAPCLAVMDSWKSVAEVGLDGKVIAIHKLDLQEEEVACNLRTATGADGKRRIVVFAPGQQRFHLLDENWKRVLSFPEDALKNRHKGIADVRLADLAGEGKLQAYLGYWDVVGVQAVSLEDGKKLWSNRSFGNVLWLGVDGPDAQKRRNLLCTHGRGTIAVLDAEGQRLPEIVVPQVIALVEAADLAGDGHLLWCGMVPQKAGKDTMVGFSLKGEELWTYALPPGMTQQAIERIIPGQVTAGGPGQWLLPGCDGSIHIVAADGKPLDRFNYGAMLTGLATVQVDGKPVLIVASDKGLEALRVE